MRRAILLAVVAALALVVLALPATATVHEITGMACAQNGAGGNPFPPGISGGSNADNFANPLFKNGFIESVEPYLDGMLISFDFDHPASKLAELPGVIFDFGGGTYVTGFVADGPYTNCKGLS
jgi:hypothetical protein